MISEEKNAPEPLCSSQAKKLPALMWHVIRQAVTPGPKLVHPGGSVGHTCNLCLPELSALSPRLAFNCKRKERLWGRWGGAVDFSGCSYLQEWEPGVCQECPAASASLLQSVLEAKGQFPIAASPGTAHLDSRSAAVS